MLVYDYVCPKCGLKLSDIMVSSRDTPVICSECSSHMNREFPAPNVKTTPRHHHSLKGYKPGKADVRFGKTKEGWY